MAKRLTLSTTAKYSRTTLHFTISRDLNPFFSNIFIQQWQNIHCINRKICAIVYLHNLFSFILDEEMTKESEGWCQKTLMKKRKDKSLLFQQRGFSLLAFTLSWSHF